MQYVTYTMMAALAAAFVYLLVSLPRALITSIEHGRRFRHQINTRLDELPLPRMLAARGIDRGHYVGSTPVVEIERHLKACRECAGKPQCENDLDAGTLTDDAAYCPNRDRLAGEAERRAA
jgi:hypothetical protein